MMKQISDLESRCAKSFWESIPFSYIYVIGRFDYVRHELKNILPSLLILKNYFQEGITSNSLNEKNQNIS